MSVVIVKDLCDGGSPVRVLADFHLLTANQGGRDKPMAGGLSYRPNHNFGSPENLVFYVGEFSFSPRDIVFPGESRRVPVRFMSGPGLRELLAQGRQWRIQEGNQCIATAQVVEILATDESN